MQFIIIVSSLLPSVCERISIGYTPTMEKEEGGVSLFSLSVSPRRRRRNKRAGAHCSVSVVLFSPLSFRVMRYTHVAMAAATRHQIVLPFNDWRCRDPLQTHTHTQNNTKRLSFCWASGAWSENFTRMLGLCCSILDTLTNYRRRWVCESVKTEES